MHTRLLQYLLIIFFSSFLHQVNSSITSCLRSSATHRGHKRVTFLRVDAAGARSLFQTVWLGEDVATMRMLSCRFNKSPEDVEHYQTAVCDSSPEDLSLTGFINVSLMTEVAANCAPQRKMGSSTQGTEVKIRRKRGWIFPGTLWCGMNTKAATYEELGMFANADRCCRDHDHCKHTIPSFTVNYGVFNPNFYTLSHCDCDQRFRQCLLGVNDTISTMVGYSFFNIFRVPCFELKEQQQCTKMYWWGMCKVARKAPYAVLKNSHPYNSSNVSSKFEADTNNSNNSKETKHDEKHITKITVISTRQKSPKVKSGCRSRDPPRGDTFYQRRKGKRCKTNRTVSESTELQTPPKSAVNITVSSATAGLSSTSTKSGLLSGSKRGGVKKSNGVLSTDSYPQAFPTTQSVPSSTRRQTTYQRQPLAKTVVTKTIKNHITDLKQSHCCESVRGDTFWSLCKNCSNAQTTLITAAATMTPPTIWRKTATTPGPMTTFKDTNKFTRPATTQLKVTDSRYGDRKLQNWTDSFPFKKHLNQRSMSRTSENITIAEEAFKKSHTVSDHELLCKSLKHLDECTHQIPPLEKKYGLRNKESKTVYHCNCTTSFSDHIRIFRQHSVLPTLLTDFVSQHCFKLRKEKKCQPRKSCSRFIKAYNLIRTLKKMKTKDAAGGRLPGSDRKRGIPVRLYKRCLKLWRGIDNVEQLTW